MSRLGKKPVPLGKAKATIGDGKVTISSSSTTLELPLRREVTVTHDSSTNQLVVDVPERLRDSKQAQAMWGTTRAHLANMVKGVTDGYEKKLEVVGVGYAATLSGQNLDLKVGFANQIRVPIPAGLTVTVEKQLITIKGSDKQMVGQFAAVVRGKRPPEPYNGKGIKYSDEVVRRKQGKTVGG